MEPEEQALKGEIDNQRQALLERLQDWLELPMLVLAFIWLALFLVEVLRGLSPFLEILGYVIWAFFAFEYALGFTLAPRKTAYLRANWLKAVSLAAPALRVLRVARVLRLARLGRAAGMSRGLRLLRLLSSLNRGMRALGASMGRRGFGYIMLLTLIVILTGAAGMYAFESELPGGQGLDSYSDALWWTAMILTTLGSEYWPQTAAGRILCLFLSLYGFAVFGYVTATLATYFIGSDAENAEAEVAGAGALERLREEVAGLRDEIRRLRE